MKLSEMITNHLRISGAVRKGWSKSVPYNTLSAWRDKAAQLEAENDAGRELATLVQCKWEEFGNDDGVVTIKYPWAIQERMRELSDTLPTGGG